MMMRNAFSLECSGSLKWWLRLLSSGIAVSSIAVAQQSQPLVLDLEKAMDMAAQHSFAARIARETVTESDRRDAQTLESMGPRLELDATKLWLSKKVNKTVGETIGSSKVPSVVTKASVTFAQPIIALAPLYLKLQADMLTTKMARDDEVQSKKDARFSGAEAYLRLEKAQEMLRIAEQSLAVVDKQRSDGIVLEKNGRLGRADLLRLELALSDGKSQLAQAQNLKEIALTLLQETLGLPDNQNVVVQPAVRSKWEEKNLSVPQLPDMVTKSLSVRSDIKSAEGRLYITEQMKRASDFDYLPSLTFIAKYERDFEANGINMSIPNGASRPTVVRYDKNDLRDSLSYGLTAKWTIWDWGARLDRSREFAASIRKANLARDAIESKVRLEVTQAVLDLRYAVDALATAKDSLAFAEEVYRLQNVRFLNGTATTTDLITSERDQTRARGGMVGARADLDLAWLKMQKANGTEPSTK